MSINDWIAQQVAKQRKAEAAKREAEEKVRERLLKTWQLARDVAETLKYER